MTWLKSKTWYWNVKNLLPAVRIKPAALG